MLAYPGKSDERTAAESKMLESGVSSAGRSPKTKSSVVAKRYAGPNAASREWAPRRCVDHEKRTLIAVRDGRGTLDRLVAKKKTIFITFPSENGMVGLVVHHWSTHTWCTPQQMQHFRFYSLNIQGKITRGLLYSSLQWNFCSFVCADEHYYNLGVAICLDQRPDEKDRLLIWKRYMYPVDATKKMWPT